MNWQAMNWTLVVGLASTMGTAAVRAQSPEDIVTRVIALEHVDSATAVNAVSDLSIDELYAVTSASRVNKVIVQGSGNAVEAIERVILELDRAPKRGEPGALTITDYVSIGTYPPEDLRRIAHTALPLGQSTKIAVDEVNNRLVVSGPQEDIVAVRSLVAKLDRPRNTYQVEFFFIRSGGSGSAELPKALAPIAASLEQSGFGLPSMMSPLIVRVDDGATFEQQARYTQRYDDGVSEQIELRVSGDVRSAMDGETLRIELSAQMIGVRSEISSSNAFFEVDTELSIPQGRYAVLAAAPASTRDADAVALVVHVKSGALD